MAASPSAYVPTRNTVEPPVTARRANHLMRSSGGASRPDERPAARRAAGGPRPAERSEAAWYYANSSSKKDESREAEQVARRRDRKRQRYDLRTHVWSVSSIERCRKCGRVSVKGDGAVGLRTSGDSAGFSGLSTCGSVWVCPVCAAKVARRRGEELGQVLAWSVDQGHTAFMLTLTARHHAGMRLTDTWTGVQNAWQRITSGRAWAGESDRECAARRERWETGPRGMIAGKPWVPQKIGIRDQWGLLGWARAIEVTHGHAAGWHPHLHIVGVLEGEQTRDCVERLGDALWPLWESALEREGLSALRGPGLDIRTSSDDVAEGLAKYLVKSLAMEAVHGHAKDGRGGSRSPFQILADVTATGDADDLDLWHEYEQASHGRRQLTWSQGLRELAGLGEEQTDEEIAAEEVEGDDVLVFTRDTWAVIAPQQVDLLIATERFGLPGARAWLRQRDLDWIETPGAEWVVWARKVKGDDGATMPATPAALLPVLAED